MKMVDGSTVRHGRVDWRSGGEGDGCTVTGRVTQWQVKVRVVRARDGRKEEEKDGGCDFVQ